jgi:hypothetical protein
VLKALHAAMPEAANGFGANPATEPPHDFRGNVYDVRPVSMTRVPAIAV